MPTEKRRKRSDDRKYIAVRRLGEGGGVLLISAYASSYHCLAETSVECTFQIYLNCGSSVFEHYQRLQAEDLPEGRGGEGEGLQSLNINYISILKVTRYLQGCQQVAVINFRYLKPYIKLKPLLIGYLNKPTIF